MWNLCRLWISPPLPAALNAVNPTSPIAYDKPSPRPTGSPTASPTISPTACHSQMDGALDFESFTWGSHCAAPVVDGVIKLMDCNTANWAFDMKTYPAGTITVEYSSSADSARNIYDATSFNLDNQEVLRVTNNDCAKAQCATCTTPEKGPWEERASWPAKS